MNTRFQDVVSYDIGGGWGTDIAQPGSESPGYVIRGTDIPRVAVGDVSTVPLRFHKDSNLASRKLQSGDIVFEVSGGSKGQPVGRALQITDKVLRKFDEPVMCASFCKLIRLDPGRAFPGYVFRVLQAAYADGGLDSFQVQSTGITNFKWKPFLQHFKIELPDPKVQRRVASVLDSFDDLIENNRRRVTVLEEMARAVYREWFVRFRYPGHTDAPLVESPLGPIPEMWHAARIGSFGRVITGTTPATKQSQFWGTPSDTPFLTPSEMGWQHIYAKPARYLSAVGVAEARTRLLPAGAVCFASIGSIGKVAVTVEPTVTNQQVNSVIVDQAVASTPFVFEALSYAAEAIKRLASGAATPIINKSAFANIQLVLPPHALAHAFAQQVGPLHSLIFGLEQHSETLEVIRGLLLPKLVTGQIDVSTLVLDVTVSSSSIGEGAVVT